MSKADLKKITRVEVSTRNVDRKDCTVLDGCAILRCIALHGQHQKSYKSSSSQCLCGVFQRVYAAAAQLG